MHSLQMRGDLANDEEKNALDFAYRGGARPCMLAVPSAEKS
jgi:hypothetical protein